jgi:tubulin monoglycylase TTLL3/8
MNRILRNYPPDFIFKYWRDKLVWELLLPEQILNQHMKSHFTNKISITDRIQESHWISEEGLAHPLFPRCYRLSDEEERIAFIHDFRLTACMSLLEWVVQAYESGGDSSLIGTYGSPTACVDTAITHVTNYVRVRKHEDLDSNINNNTPVIWEVFLSRYYNAVFLKRKLAPEIGQTSLKDKYEAAMEALAAVKPFWPQRNVDGKFSMWICKPGAQARGRGIVVMNQLEKILNLLNESPNLHWVAQKYIERPLLVHNTKFDIRQWFLVSNWRPLTVWFYKECYLRFCSKPFDIEDFHESIHLCNNVVQSRYDISKNRDPALPKENMWDNKTFANYLNTIGQSSLWSEKISPGMKQGILAVLLATENHIEEDSRRNCFEIYGADFMLSEDLTPWIIEINRSPCMEYTTDVTSRLCRQCLEDSIKVVIDRRENPHADTGLFELIYQGESSSMPFKSQDPNEANLIIHGKGLPHAEPQTGKLPSGSNAATPRAHISKQKSTGSEKPNVNAIPALPSKQTADN